MRRHRRWCCTTAAMLLGSSAGLRLLSPSGLSLRGRRAAGRRTLSAAEDLSVRRWISADARAGHDDPRVVVEGGPPKALGGEDPQTPTSLVVVPDGVCAVYKPAGWTSADAVAKIRTTLERAAFPAGAPSAAPPGRRRRKMKPKLKVGHGGTLDPMATGVLVVGVGRGCKELDAYLSGPKRYRAEAVLGTATDTLDALGTVVRTAPSDHVTRAALETALVDFRGDILQVPPMYSALRKDGKRLYELARKGVEVDREARRVSVTVLDLLLDDDDDADGDGDDDDRRGDLSAESATSSRLALPRFGLDIECGGGTYVRSLISDIAEHDAVRSAAHMTSLERTHQGVFGLEDCLPVEKWTAHHLVAHLEACSARRGPLLPTGGASHGDSPLKTE